MSFIGPVNKLGDTFVRPHDVEILLHSNGSTSEAVVDHLVYLGFEVRVELTLDDGRAIWAQVTREEAKQLELESGKHIHVRLAHSRVFEQPAEGPFPTTGERANSSTK